jgi:heme oxygenase (biliverdin-producing, ferredoxin)
MALSMSNSEAFAVLPKNFHGTSTTIFSAMGSTAATSTAGGFIESELRAKAMTLHTRSQASKEGKAEEKEQRKPYQTTHADYLAFLVDSQHVYKAMEDVVNEHDALEVFRNTGLERVAALEKDIEFMMKEYDLELPKVGRPGSTYADEMRALGKEAKFPEFLCHYYNFYFAHTAGGRMIGKQMSAMLLDKKTLEFYKVRTDSNAS